MLIGYLKKVANITNSLASLFFPSFSSSFRSLKKIPQVNYISEIVKWYALKFYVTAKYICEILSKLLLINN